MLPGPLTTVKCNTDRYRSKLWVYPVPQWVLLRPEYCCPVPILRRWINEEALAALYAAERSNVAGKVSLKGSGKLKGAVEIPLKVALKDSIEVSAIPYLQSVQCIHVSALLGFLPGT
jgi:hypothetical protein